MPAPTRRPVPTLLPALALAAVVFGLQWLLWTNPGYFSHDELQWGARADVARWADLPWMAWTDVAAFQWRPLTFNLWLLASQALFDTPPAFHALWVAAGSAIAAALAALLRRLGASWPQALAAGAVFALNPYAVYVHGWVATAADLLWVGTAVALAHAVVSAQQRGRAGAGLAVLAFALTAAALLAKEAAVVMPALLGLVAVLRRDRVLAWATAGSALAVLAYLGLRLGVLLAPSADSGYALAPASAPRHWAAYHLFLLRTSALEVENTWLASGRFLVVAALLWAGLVAGVARASPRLALALLAGGVASLAPVLLLSSAASQYGYGFSAWIIACVALAWPGMRRPSRALSLLFVLVVGWHGANVQREMRRVGEIQARFQPALVQALAAGAGPVRIRHAGADQWIYQRLTHDVPAWRGQPIGDRVLWVGGDAPADYALAADGDLRPVGD